MLNGIMASAAIALTKKVVYKSSSRPVALYTAAATKFDKYMYILAYSTSARVYTDNKCDNCLILDLVRH